jgi:hypothetical protein
MLMTPVESGGFAKFIETVKDLPAWLLTSLAVSDAILLFSPQVNRELPAESRPWLVAGAVVFGVMATFKWSSVAVAAAKAWRLSAKVPKTFHLTPIAQLCHWSITRQADGSYVTQISARFSAKNQSDHPIGLLPPRVIKPSIRGEIVEAMLTVRQQHGHMHGTAHASDHRIAPGTTLPAQSVVMIRGTPRRKQGSDLDVTLGISDEDGNEQRVRILCRGITAPKVEEGSKLIDPLHAISDRIEKDVAAVLQSEIGRYEKNGRFRGGFGSFHMTYDGRSDQQVPGDVWVMNTAKNQEISEKADQNLISSDNFEALLAIHSTLTSEDERMRFANALLSRLQENRGYTSVAYMIMMVLWRVGLLGEGLKAATRGLPRDDPRNHGMSNVLMLLNAMLRIQHFQFSDETLDTIERFIEGNPEFAFRIPQKIAAVRAFRVMSAHQIDRMRDAAT